MKAEIISVGTELLLGHTINSDAAFIAREIAGMGIDIYKILTVGDNRLRLENALKEALKNNDIVITSGGLGPTEDDLTKECAARVANLPLEENRECLASLKEYFQNREMSKNQLKQAMIPKGAKIFKNPNGTAPGCAIPAGDGKYICILPGPPGELVPMLQNELRPFLQTLSSQIIKSAILRCFGIGEGQAAEKLQGLTSLQNPTVATYAGNGEMFVKVTAKANSDSEVEELLKPVINQVKERLGDFIYARDANNLEEKVVSLLREKKLHVATAESCTGGLLASRITSQPGASEIFHLGVVTYANEAKEKILHVKSETLREFGAVSSQTAEEMAWGIKKVANADFGIGITGIAGPDGGTLEKPVGLVYIALASDKIYINKLTPSGRYLGRDWVRNRAVLIALDMLRRKISSLPVCIKM